LDMKKNFKLPRIKSPESYETGWTFCRLIGNERFDFWQLTLLLKEIWKKRQVYISVSGQYSKLKICDKKHKCPL
jgi:hypothetical protein